MALFSALHNPVDSASKTTTSLATNRGMSHRAPAMCQIRKAAAAPVCRRRKHFERRKRMEGRARHDHSVCKWPFPIVHTLSLISPSPTSLLSLGVAALNCQSSSFCCFLRTFLALLLGFIHFHCAVGKVTSPAFVAALHTALRTVVLHAAKTLFLPFIISGAPANNPLEQLSSIRTKHHTTPTPGIPFLGRSIAPELVS